jgi:hypothetical protein
MALQATGTGKTYMFVFLIQDKQRVFQKDEHPDTEGLPLPAAYSETQVGGRLTRSPKGIYVKGTFE